MALLTAVPGRDVGHSDTQGWSTTHAAAIFIHTLFAACTGEHFLQSNYCKELTKLATIRLPLSVMMLSG